MSEMSASLSLEVEERGTSLANFRYELATPSSRFSWTAWDTNSRIPVKTLSGVTSKKQSANFERQVTFMRERYPDAEIVRNVGSGFNLRSLHVCKSEVFAFEKKGFSTDFRKRVGEAVTEVQSCGMIALAVPAPRHASSLRLLRSY